MINRCAKEALHPYLCVILSPTDMTDSKTLRCQYFQHSEQISYLPNTLPRKLAYLYTVFIKALFGTNIITIS